jgi:hypothetical protein
MAGVEVGMGSSLESDFAPFFVVADKRSQVRRVLDEATVRGAFGGCLYPGVRVVVEPLEERGEWWTLVRESLVDNDDALEDDELMEEGRAELSRWREMIRWFRGRPGIRSASAVLIDAGGRRRKGWTCCNFPCLIVGLTGAGSLVGIWGARVDR